MVEMANKILNKEIRVNKYEKLFSTDEPGGDSEPLKNINALFAELMPYINSGEVPDFDALAAPFDVDPETAREMYKQVTHKIKGSNQ